MLAGGMLQVQCSPPPYTQPWKVSFHGFSAFPASSSGAARAPAQVPHPP